MHLGEDLASNARSPVPAANAGRHRLCGSSHRQTGGPGRSPSRLPGRRRGGILLATAGLVGAGFLLFEIRGVDGNLVPIVGLPLPLMSYGGSSMMATLLGFGLVLNVKMRRFVN